MFTAQRQDVYEIYSRIAYEAKSSAGDADITKLTTAGSSSAQFSFNAASSADSSASVAVRKAKVLSSAVVNAAANALGTARGWMPRRGSQKR